MTDRYKVYTKIMKTLKQMVKLHHPGHVVTLAMMITGIVMSKKAQLSEMSSEIPGKSKDKSREMRLRRWVKHAGLDAELIYLPFAQQVLTALSGTELVLVMDGSLAGRGCMVLMVGVLYKKRALPIAWLVQYRLALSSRTEAEWLLGRSQGSDSLHAEHSARTKLCAGETVTGVSV